MPPPLDPARLVYQIKDAAIGKVHRSIARDAFNADGVRGSGIGESVAGIVGDFVGSLVEANVGKLLGG